MPFSANFPRRKQSMTRRVPRAVVAAVTVLAVVTGCSTGTDAVSQTAGGSNRYVAGDGTTIVYQVGQRKPAPAITGSTLDGGSASLAAQRGNVVVMNFWASWCAPCRLESSALEDTYQATRSSGIAFIGVNSRDEKDAARSFESSRRLTYPSLFDPNGRIPLRFSDVPTTLPCTLIIDRSGKVAVIIRAAVVQDKLAALIRQVSAEKP